MFESVVAKNRRLESLDMSVGVWSNRTSSPSNDSLRRQESFIQRHHELASHCSLHDE